MANGDNHTAKVTTDAVDPKKGHDDTESPTSKLQLEGNPGPAAKVADAKAADATEKLKVVGLDQAKEAIESGKPVTIKIDSTKGTDEAAELNKILQGENGYVTLVKPALQPGSKGYYEVDAPKVTEPVSLSTREKPLTGSYTADGVSHTVDQFPNGTIFDGKTIRSADPSATGVQIGDTFVPNGTPADAKGGQQTSTGDRIVVRKTTGEDGKPKLDTYPIGDTPGPNGEPSSFQQRWDTAQDGHFKPRPVPTEHTILPPNVTVDSTTKYGEVTIKPGDGFRADGFGVGPKEMRETWNGFSDEKGYQFLKDMYAKNGMSDSTQMQTLSAERIKAYENTPPVTVGLDQAKEAIESGKPVTIKIDSTKGTDEAAQLNKILQGENGFVTLVKPALQPGSKGYYEVDAPKVTDPVSLSTREKPLTGSYTVDGVSHDVDKFPNGTVFDGKTIRSADPSATGVQIGDTFVPNGTPADAKGGQQTSTGDRIVVRKTTGEDGKPVLDTYPIGDTPGPNGEPSSFQQRWDTAQDGHFKPRPVPTEHTILPPNVTIDSTTKYGEVTIKPGDGFRADGFGVGPKEMRETWNGFSDEKGYQFLKDMYAKNGMSDSTQMQTLSAERIKAYENTPPVTVGLDQAKEAIESGKPVTIKIDSTKGTDEAAQLNKILQGENGFVTLVKPALQPGSKGYYEVDAPKVTDPVSLSTREKPLTGSYTVDGVSHDVDKFPNGTVFDGKTIRSADPSATGVQIGDTFVPNGTPADAKGGQQTSTGDRIVVRKTTGEDGKPVLDTYPIGDTPGPNGEPSSFQQRWDTAQDGHFKPRPVPTEHTILPPNVTIDSTTKYGEVTIKPGDGFRADGFGVGPKEMRETWNGFSDDKGYQFLKDMYAKNGMSDSTQMETLEAERSKTIAERAAAVEAAKVAPQEAPKTATAPETAQDNDKVWKPGDDAKDGTAAAGFKPSDAGDGSPVKAVEQLASALGGVKGVDAGRVDAALGELNAEQRDLLRNMSDEDRAKMMDRVKADLKNFDPGDGSKYTEDKDGGGRLLTVAALAGAVAAGIAFYEYMKKSDQDAPVVTYAK